MIEAVLWDFGGVFTASPFHSTRSYADALGVEHQRLLDTVFEPYHADTDHPWHRVERGELALAAALDEVTRTAVTDLHGEFDMKAFFGAMRDEVDRSFVVEAVRTLRERGIRHVIVTNNAREFAASWTAMVPMELFDDLVDSSAVGVRKPNPEIYRLAMQRAGVSAPGRAVFLDDFEPNVAAARELGLHGIVVGADPRAAIDALFALVG